VRKAIASSYGDNLLDITVTYLSETMIFWQYAGCDAHVFLRAHQRCAFEIVEALKTLPFLLDPGNSVRRK